MWKQFIPTAYIAILSIALITVCAVPDWGRVDWGDAPTWISAVTTLGALIAAGIVVVVELNRDKVRATERIHQQERDEAQQADLVAAWYDQRGVVVIRNASDLPVYALSAWVTPMTGARYPLEEEPVVPPASEPIRRILPEADRIALRTVQAGVEITFRDAAGRTWRRDENGTLIRLGSTIFPSGVPSGTKVGRPTVTQGPPPIGS